MAPSAAPMPIPALAPAERLEDGGLAAGTGLKELVDGVETTVALVVVAPVVVADEFTMVNSSDFAIMLVALYTDVPLSNTVMPTIAIWQPVLRISQIMTLPTA